MSLAGLEVLSAVKGLSDRCHRMRTAHLLHCVSRAECTVASDRCHRMHTAQHTAHARVHTDKTALCKQSVLLQVVTSEREAVLSGVVVVRQVTETCRQLYSSMQ
jgi:hypothetical protein